MNPVPLSRTPKPATGLPGRRVAVFGAFLALGAILTAACGGDPKAAPSDVTAVPPATVTATPGAVEQFGFDSDPVGDPPVGSDVYSGDWVVERAADAPSAPNAVCQRATETYPAMRLGDAVYGDVSITAKVKPISGDEDQAAGLIVRLVDDRNYYVVRANALEDNVSIYVYENGTRSLFTEGSADVRDGVWQDLTVDVHGSTIIASFAGEEVARIDDHRFPTGGIGLWTKADSQTCFDDIVATG